MYDEREYGEENRQEGKDCATSWSVFLAYPWEKW